MHSLHTKAIQLSKNYLQSEKDLLSILIEMEKAKLFLSLGFTGLFNYCLKALSFSESQASYFTQVVRKSIEVPALKAAIDSGELTVSKARRVVPVITQASHKEWIEKAKTLPQRELECEVASVNPKAVKERLKPVSAERFEMKLGLSKDLKAKWDRVRDLSKDESMEDVLESLLDLYLEKKDPVMKAERSVLRKVRSEAATRASRKIPASIAHQVQLRDQGKCQTLGCTNSRYTEIHHQVPYAKGGSHTASNLITLCSAHHRMEHVRKTIPCENRAY